jgi:multiple sugar transport system substrate-binding protein
MLKRIFLLFLTSILITGCSSKKQEEITFSSWGSISEVTILKQLISNFEEENPDIKINFMHIPQNYFQKIHLLFASNTAPDILFINNLNLPIYASKLEPLESYINQEEFYPQSLDGLSFDGHLLAIPRDISNLVFYINLDLMNKPSKNWNLDEFMSLLLSQTNNFGVSFEDDIYWAMPYLLAFDGGLLDDNYNNIVDSENSQKGLKFYTDLRDKYHVAPTKSQVGSSTLAQMFLDGKIALYLSGRWMFPKILEKAGFNWEVIPFPSSVPCDCSGWAISKDSKHKTSAIKFVQYLSSEESSEYFTQTNLIVPARIKTSSKLNNNEHNEKIFLDVIKTSKKIPISKNYKKLTDEVNLKIKE